MARVEGPLWIVAPDDPTVPPTPGDIPHPDHELPGDQPSVEHPIVLPPDAETPDDVHPEHPIVLPPDLGIWPNPPEGSVLPEHPIVLPPDMPDGPGDAIPSHPIYFPPYPDNSLPAGLENAGEPDFYQRKTLGINWDAAFDPAKVVGIYAEGSLVRTVANDGSSSVTYPQDFTGDVTIRVAGINYYLEGTYTVQ
jgi:hypothetical protein